MKSYWDRYRTVEAVEQANVGRQQWFAQAAKEIQMKKRRVVVDLQSEIEAAAARQAATDAAASLLMSAGVPTAAAVQTAVSATQSAAVADVPQRKLTKAQKVRFYPWYRTF